MSIKKYYYVSGNTAEGLVNFLPSNVTGFEQIVILKHPSEQLKTDVLRGVIKRYEKTYDLEIMLSSISGQYLEGIIIRERSMAIIIDHVAIPDLKATVEVDLSLFLAEQKVLPIENERFHQAYNSFSAGLRIHDKLEAIYVNEMDFAKADQLADQFIRELLKDQPKRKKKSHVYRRLFGTNTTEGVVNIVPQLIESLSHVYHLKGRAGTGKSTFMKKVLAACTDYGFDVELFHCSFDPHSIDMVRVPELDFCIFDSTDPHEIVPRLEAEKIIDLYKETVEPGTDEKYAKEIQAIHSNYKSYMKQGIRQLKEAGEIVEKQEQQYAYSDKEREKIIEFIMEFHVE